MASFSTTSKEYVWERSDGIYLPFESSLSLFCLVEIGEESNAHFAKWSEMKYTEIERENKMNGREREETGISLNAEWRKL